MITDNEIEAALDELLEAAEKAAKARAERLYLDKYSKHHVANLMNKSTQKSEAGREREALSDESYLAHVVAYHTACMRDFELTFRREALLAKIEAWRTQSSNVRAAHAVV